MRPRRALCALFLLFAAAAAAAPNTTVANVVSIRSAEHFDEHIAASHFTFVKFFHPDCPHCQRLQRPFAQLVHPLRRHNANASTPPRARVQLAQVDASNRRTAALLRRHSAAGFPTLKLYRSAALVAEHNGPRTTSAMFQFLLHSIALSQLPLLSHLPSERRVRRFLDAVHDRPVVLSVHPPPPLFVHTASEMRTSTASTAAFATVAHPALLMLNRTNRNLNRLQRRYARAPMLAAAPSAATFGARAQFWFPHVRDGESVPSFIHAAVAPPHQPIQLSRRTAPHVLHAERPMLLAFGAPDAPTWSDIYFLAHADAEPPHLLPVYIPIARFPDFANFVGLNVSRLPLDRDAFLRDWNTQFVVYSPANMHPVLSRYDPAMNVSGATWLYQQRQRVNSTLVDTYAGELMHFSHRQLKAMLSFDGRGVLLLTYTAHCRLCEKYANVMRKVATVLKPHAGFIVVARVDVGDGFPYIAEVNNLDAIKTAPSIVWLCAGERVVLYQGSMSAHAVSRFARQMAAVPAQFERGVEWVNVTAAYALVIGLGLIVTAQLLWRRKRARFTKRQHVT